ncbi:MAG: type IV secretion system DNA-binding domain-containing protein [Patescibacteria group bacterium]|nr:type IV secretion system DNA-binding domain-containing protein [Patescibacteria group bacterium]
MANDINFFGQTTFRNEGRKFGIKLDDRRKHVYVVGKTGRAKPSSSKNMAVQDIREGRGIGFIDPHGEAAEDLLEFVPKERMEDVVYFNPGDLDFPISFNVMENVDVEHRHLVASGLMSVFKKIWPDVWSARMEYILNNCILALLEYPSSTLLGINRMLADEDYRERIIRQVQDPIIKAFWLSEYSRYTQRYEVEATAAIQNKIGQFISAPLIRNIIGQAKSSMDMRALMDQGKILILDVSKGRIGEDASKLLGGLLITKLQLAAMSRVDIVESERKDFFLYVDEFQNFATESFVNILSEARKYRLDLTLGHQYIAQMEESVRDAVFGNVGTLIAFRVGADDAEYLEKEFAPEFFAQDLVNLANHEIYLKLIIDGIASKPFSAQTLPPFEKPAENCKQEIIHWSREHYAMPRETVEAKISQWTGSFILKNQATSPPVELFDAKCSSCNKKIKVPFKPEPSRSIFCRACLKKKDKPDAESGEGAGTEDGNENENEQNPLSLEELLLKEPVYFSKAKQKEAKENQNRPAIDRDKLQEALRQSQQEIIGGGGDEEGGEDNGNGLTEIKPGDTVNF